MMICPKCRSEYRDGFDTCADCYGPLVVATPEILEPAPEPAHDDGELVAVFESSDPWVMMMARSALEGAGIACSMRGDSLGTAPAVIEVSQAEAAKADALLADLRGATTLLANRSMPPGTIIPELAYPDVREAAAWLCRAFGFRERLRIGDHRVQLILEDASIVAIELPRGQQAAEAFGTHGVMVRVADAQAHHDHAREAGARITSPPTEYPFGERQYSAVDPAGHRWTFSESIEDVDPADWGGEIVEL